MTVIWLLQWLYWRKKLDKFYFPSDIREADVRAVKEFAIPSLTLMENAGMSAANELIKRFSSEEKILVLCGPGNNGGDGFVAARYLLQSNRMVFVLTTILPDKYQGDAAHNLKELIKLDISSFNIKSTIEIEDDEISKLILDSDIVVDAMLGTGTSGIPRGEISRLIKLLPNDIKTISFDIPSGIDPFTGSISDECVKSDITLTFLAPKTGMSFPPARDMCGEIITLDIGISQEKVLNNIDHLSTYTREDMKDMLPVIPRDIHKGNRGAVLILGGSYNYRGAPILSALAALRTGAGLVVLAIPDYMVDSAAMIIPEAIFVPLETKAGMILPNNIPNVLSFWLKKCNAAVFGPGIGRYLSVPEMLSWFWNNWNKPLVVDADALSYISSKNLPFKSNIIITPHSAEAASILECTAEEVNLSRLESSLKLAKISGVAVLKGKDTIISSGNNVRMVREGSPALAVPGSGDVLAGAIAAFCAADYTVFDAALAGTLLHALAGSNIEAKKGSTGTLAREIANELQNVIRQ